MIEDQKVSGKGIGFHRPGVIARHAILSIGFTLLFLVLNLPEIIFITKLGSVAWYPAMGLSFALLLAISPWYSILVCLVGAIAGSVFYHQPIWTYGAILGSVSEAAVYGIAAYILRGPLRIDLRLRRSDDVVSYIFVSLSAAILSAAIGVLCLIADHTIPAHEFWSAYIHWFIGDSVGLVGLTPALLINIFPWARRFRWLSGSEAETTTTLPVDRSGTTGLALLESTGQCICLVGTLWVMFGSHWANLELFYLSFIPILWMAMRGGIELVPSGTIALNFGIIVAMHLFPPNPELLTRIGLLMLVVSGTGLIVGSAVTDREQMGTKLHERTTYLNALFEKSPLGIVVLDRDGRVDLVNDAFTNLSLYRQSELVDCELDSVFLPVGTDEDPGTWSMRELKDKPVNKTVRRRRKDGTVLDIELQAVPLIITGRFEGAYAICKDITERVRAAAAEREQANALNRLVQELALQAGQMTVLNEMAGLLECSATVKEACVVVGQFARKFFPESISGTLYTFKASRNLVEAAASWGESAALEPVFSPQSCWALRRGRPHWSNADGGIVCSHFSAHKPVKHLCLPMVAQGETLGVLEIEFPLDEAGPPALADTRQTLAVTVANEIALSLGSLQLRETLRDQSIRDSLTGLSNRRFMQEALEREIMRARRKKSTISLLYIDIDHFKRFNDSYGHDAGDLVLKSFADLLRGFFRGEDVTCRCGGEEFAVILPESATKNAVVRAEELRVEVKKLKLRYNDRLLDPISISIGVASFPDHGSDCEGLLKAADQCLYQSKSSGRDRVTAASQLTSHVQEQS